MARKLMDGVKIAIVDSKKVAIDTDFLDARKKVKKSKFLGTKVTKSKHQKVNDFCGVRHWNVSRFIERAIDESMEKVAFDCKDCGNYVDDKFESVNCNGCSKNPFYINCFTPKKVV